VSASPRFPPLPLSILMLSGTPRPLDCHQFGMARSSIRRPQLAVYTKSGCLRLLLILVSTSRRYPHPPHLFPCLGRVHLRQGAVNFGRTGALSAGHGCTETSHGLLL
jgi:hypothetical protein